MFRKKTVFVLGAGASWHYGYPTGEELVSRVINCTRSFQTYCKSRAKTGFNENQFPDFMGPAQPVHTSLAAQKIWADQIANCEDLIKRLEAVQPVVIDYFLGWNEPLHELGRVMIAGALLACEATGAGVPMPSGVRTDYDGNNNWIRFVVHQLMMECSTSSELLQNDVHFITFNYDRSFERNLRHALVSIGFLSKTDIDDFLKYPRIVHMYGALANGGPVSQYDYAALFDDYAQVGLDPLESATRLINRWADAAKELRVIDPHTKNDDKTVEEAKGLLWWADRIFFLGYGFDPENNRRLGFPRIIAEMPKRELFFTNYRDTGTANLHASVAFGMSDVRNLPGTIFSTENRTAQKSIRNCYEALALDFGMLSEA